MNLFGVLDISGSALMAERIRAEVTTVNMANVETTRTAAGGPYRRQQVVFATAGADSSRSFSHLLGLPSQATARGLVAWRPGQTMSPGGVEIAAIVPDTSEPIRRYDPQHPDADKNGIVELPDINPLTEMVDLIGASRAYGLNSSAIQATKGMIVASLDLAR